MSVPTLLKETTTKLFNSSVLAKIISVTQVKYEDKVNQSDHHATHNDVHIRRTTTDKLSAWLKSRMLRDITQRLDPYKKVHLILLLQV